MLYNPKQYDPKHLLNYVAVNLIILINTVPLNRQVNKIPYIYGEASYFPKHFGNPEKLTILSTTLFLSKRFQKYLIRNSSICYCIFLKSSIQKKMQRIMSSIFCMLLNVIALKSYWHHLVH